MSQTLVELPQSDDAEKSVLGAILVDNRHLAEIGDVLGTDDFYRPAHQAVFQAMVEMDNRGRPIDVLTLAEELKERGQLETIGGPMYVSQLMDGIPHLINVKHYAGIVRDHSIRRQLVKAASEVLNQAATTDGNVEEVLDKAEQGILAIGEKRAAAGFTSINELLAQSLDLIEERQKSDSHITGIPTGFDDFDDMTSGLQRGDLIVVAARPSMGKTALALTAAQNAAVRFGAKVAVFSLEMSSVQLALRMLFSEARVDMQKMRRGNLSDHHWNKLIKAYKRLDSAPIYLDDTAGSTVMAMRSKARRLKAEVGLDLIVVDYLQLMSGGGGKSENRQQEISAISRGLKEMGRELD
ncbi:MAG: replicative DNA helicase, partial [Acidobacteriota bacterium]